MLSSRKTATQTRPSSSPKRHVPPLENRTISSCVRIVERAAGDLATLNSAPGSLSALDGIRSNNYPRRRNGRANSLAKVIQTACRRYLGGMRGHLRTSALVSRRRSNLWRIRRILYSSSWLPLVAYGNHERATSHNKDLVQRIYRFPRASYTQHFSPLPIVLFSESEAVHPSFSKNIYFSRDFLRWDFHFSSLLISMTNSVSWISMHEIST